MSEPCSADPLVTLIANQAKALWDANNALRADLENERAMRAAEHDDTHSRIEKLHAELVEARAELERERMRLAACGVVAMADTPESAAKARDMHADYRSASCDDVARIVDKLMEARAELAKAEHDLDSARHELEWEGCERMKATEQRDRYRAAIEAHNASAKATGLVWADDWLIPLPTADSAGAYPTHYHRHACPALYGEACACDAMPIDRGEASAEPRVVCYKCGAVNSPHESHCTLVQQKTAPLMCQIASATRCYDYPACHCGRLFRASPPPAAEVKK
jgi:hypothetical protein